MIVTVLRDLLVYMYFYVFTYVSLCFVYYVFILCVYVCVFMFVCLCLWLGFLFLYYVVYVCKYTILKLGVRVVTSIILANHQPAQITDWPVQLYFFCLPQLNVTILVRLFMLCQAC